MTTLHIRLHTVLPILLIPVLLALSGCGGGESNPAQSGPAAAQRHAVAAKTSPLPPDDKDCPYGGILVKTGIDDNGNGRLDDPEEVDEEQKVCNGAPGANGADGLNALVSVTPEPAGAHCQYGGLRVDSGRDANGNGRLDQGEIEHSGYVCDIVTAGWAPAAPELSLIPETIKRFRFTWDDVSGETEYRLLEDPDGHSGYSLIQTLPADSTEAILEGVSLPERINARYLLAACNSAGCNYSFPRYVSGTLEEAVGYLKASNTDAQDRFGSSLALSADGNTLAVGAPWEDSDGSSPDDNSAPNAGAVYLFVRGDGGSWTQQAYLKAANADAGDQFGFSVALSADGNTLAVGAIYEDSDGSSPDDNSAPNAGAVYLFVRGDGGSWAQQAYLKAANADAQDRFGYSLALSTDGNTLAVGAIYEASDGSSPDDNSAFAAGAAYLFIRSGQNWNQLAYLKAANAGNGDRFGSSLALSADGNTLAVGAIYEESDSSSPNDNSAPAAGAAYVFVRRAPGVWTQQAYLKAANADAGDQFGSSLAVSADGNTLAVGAIYEASDGSSPDGNSAPNAGAVYLFVRGDGGSWAQQAYLKASNADTNDWFGYSLALSADGRTLVVGAPREDSAATGIDGDRLDDSATTAGAVYRFHRSNAGWRQEAYLKAPNTEANDLFGQAVTLSADGHTLVVGAPWEDSAATGINGDQQDDSSRGAGATYLY